MKKVCIPVSCALLALSLGAPPAVAGQADPIAQTRCGWFDNATPGNAVLIDGAGEWTIAMQGGHQARGAWPTFTPQQWVRTGTGSAGHGCACLRWTADASTQEVLQILSARARPLKACRQDAALAGLEPVNPLAAPGR
jgi:hypothetical protein